MGPSPIRLKDRTAGKLLEGLPQEFGTGQAPMNPNAGTAFFGDRSDAGELLHLSGEFKAAAVGAESGEQTRSQRRTSTRKAAKQGRVTMLIEQRSDLLVVAFNGFAQQRDLWEQCLNLHRVGQQHGAVLGQRLSLLDIGDQLFQLVFAAIALRFVELPNR